MQKLFNILLTSALVSATSLATAAPVAYSINSDGPDSLTHDSLYRIDLATGQETRIGLVNSQGLVREDVEGLAFAPDGTLYGIDDEAMRLFPINPDNGAVLVRDDVSISGLEGAGSNDFGMTFTCDGSLFVTSVSQGSLYRLTLDGTATEIGSLGVNISAIAAFGDTLYGLGNGLDQDLKEDNPSLFSIDTGTGAATEIGPLGAAAGAYAEAGLAFDDSGTLWAITDRRDNVGFALNSQVMQLSLTDGSASAVQETGEAGFESLAITVPRGCASGGDDTAQFKVQKQFVDGTDNVPTTLNIRCNSGLPLENSFTAEPGAGVEVTFTVSDFTDGQLDCDVWETTTEDYTATYECFSTGSCDTSAAQCAFTSVSAGQENLCVIRNYPKAVDVAVAPEWIDPEGQLQGDEAVDVELQCRNILDGDGEWINRTMRWNWVFLPGDAKAAATVQPLSDGSSECRVLSASDKSAIELSSNCQDWTAVFQDGAPLTCTVSATLFFEGIPTLGRGGMIVASLLLLFTGLVFVRRF